MEKLNKFYTDSWWRTKQSVNEQVKIIKDVSKEHGLIPTIKIKKELIGYTVLVKHNKG